VKRSFLLALMSVAIPFPERSGALLRSVTKQEQRRRLIIAKRSVASLRSLIVAKRRFSEAKIFLACLLHCKQAVMLAGCCLGSCAVVSAVQSAVIAARND
jgi:hypothetical protein